MARILVIDDDDALRQMLRRMLEMAGHEVADAEDGDTGLAEFRRQPPELVITDIFMPRREGLETIMAMRREGGRRVPIIAISGGGSHGAFEHLDTAKVLGAAYTLPKPFHYSELIAIVDQALEAAQAA